MPESIARCVPRELHPISTCSAPHLHSLCTPSPLALHPTSTSTSDFDNYAPWELYEKYEKNPRLVGYCTKDDPCSEVTGLAAAGER